MGADFKAGDYKLLVEIRPNGSSAAFVSYLYVPFTLSGCGVVTLTPDLSSPRPRNTTVTWTATVTCSGPANYQFWVVTPSGTFIKVQDWSATATFAWSSGVNQPTIGNYIVEVLVRNSDASEDPYDNYKAVNYTLS